MVRKNLIKIIIAGLLSGFLLFPKPQETAALIPVTGYKQEIEGIYEKPPAKSSPQLIIPYYAIDPAKVGLSDLEDTSNEPQHMETDELEVSASIEILFTGVIVPARCIHQSLEDRGDFYYPYYEIEHLLQAPDLTIGTLNASLSWSTPKTYCEETLHLIADPANAPALTQAGFDIINMSTNHIKNCRQAGCGDTAFFETLDAVTSAGMLPVGAGGDLETAHQPLYVEINNVKFAFVSMGHIEPAAFAGEDTPGIAVMAEASIRKWVGEAAENADVVIFLPHWGPENSAKPTYIQRDLARIAVDAGADLIVGNHTHVIQGYEQIDGVWVFYGLGNFLFDQTWSLAHQQSVLLHVVFEQGEFSSFDLIPLHVDGDGRIYQPEETEYQQIMNDLEDAIP